jgi:hypothetical protein
MATIVRNGQGCCGVCQRRYDALPVAKPDSCTHICMKIGRCDTGACGSNDACPGFVKRIVGPREFAAYEAVRVSGVTNMFAVNTVGELSGLKREQILYIMEHYKELDERYG